jgi:DNA-binding transcriptional regulator GbsR (MarR family)
MNHELTSAQDKFIAAIGRMSSAYGLNRLIAQLFALLYLQGKPLSLDEMAEALGVSKGNVSVNIRELENWGAVKNVWVKGSRKDYYEAESDLKKVFFNKVRSSIQKRNTELNAMLEEFEKTIAARLASAGKDEIESIATYKKKINELKRMRDKVVGAVEMFSKII